MQDIWIIREAEHTDRGTSGPRFEVHHHQMEGLNWRFEGILPWREFMGSHRALSSFSMPDTVVYLAVSVLENPEPGASQFWMSMNESPSRLAYAAVQSVHMFLMEQIRSMGKEPIVIGLRDGHAEVTTGTFCDTFSLVSESERREIEKWHRKKSGTHTVVTPDWALGFALTLHGNGRWLKSRLVAVLLIASVASVLIHLALEALREQGQRLTAQHKQVLTQLDQKKPITQKQIDWAWFAQTLKARNSNLKSRDSQVDTPTLNPSGFEHLVFTWSKEGDVQFMAKVATPIHSRNTSTVMKSKPEGCKSGRQEWLVCSNSGQDSLDNGHE